MYIFKLALILSTACLMQTSVPGDEGKPVLQLVISFIEKCRAVVKKYVKIEFRAVKCSFSFA
jgi:hypothetical protein